MLFDTMYQILTTLLFWVEIPSLDGINDLEYVIVMALENGFGIFNLFIDVDVVAVGLGIAITVTGSKYVYDFVMWILKKIPMLGIN